VGKAAAQAQPCGSGSRDFWTCWRKMRRRQARRSGTGGSFQTEGTPRHQYARVQRLDRPTFLFCIRYVCLSHLCSGYLPKAQSSPWPTPVLKRETPHLPPNQPPSHTHTTHIDRRQHVHHPYRDATIAIHLKLPYQCLGHSTVASLPLAHYPP
jgi:hypothetical protein